MTPTKGEIYMTDFQGSGSQPQGIRPAVIVQNDFLNESLLKTTMVCVFTSVIRDLSTQPLVMPSAMNGLTKESAVKCEQVMTINKSQLIRKMGGLSPEQLEAINKAILLSLDLC
ncbi:MAG: type II toxin-antitoxin system PemK/MazF family toxin [bacterium]|nr:type II toxin-antitoxin system PemK/MazF family toxin [bacterium]